MRISDWSSDVCSSDLLGDRTPTYSLVVWQGEAVPLLMSLIALVGGTALYMIFRDRLNAAERSPLIGRLKGRRTFEAVLGAIVDAARGLHGLLGTRRLQVQLRLLIATALLVGTLPFLRLGYSRGPQIGRAHVCTPVTNA